jgi:hypothetical protein
LGTAIGTPMTPLSILDLAPVTVGSTPAQTFANALDLARAGERLGYRRYWLAEQAARAAAHHVGAERGDGRHRRRSRAPVHHPANIYDHAARVRSFELTMQAWNS